VPDGGFTDLQLLYPSPHKLCRNFTLDAFNGFPPQIQQFFPNPQKQANSSFHASNIRKILETPTGDFKNFQTALEAFEVRKSD
jgi:tyrosinase